MDAELGHETLDHAEEPYLVVEAVLHQVVEAIGAVGRPGPRHLDHEGALGGVHVDLEAVGRLLGEGGGVLQRGRGTLRVYGAGADEANEHGGNTSSEHSHFESLLRRVGHGGSTIP